MPQPFAREQQVAISAVREAARLCQAVQAEVTPDVLAKKDRSPVTVADFGSQAIVCRALGEAFENDPVVAEEDSTELRHPENAELLDQVARHLARSQPDSSRETICRWIDRGRVREYSERFWTLDPIDGTKGFLRREQYAVSLALLVAGRIELAVLACPNLPSVAGSTVASGNIFCATRGQGAWSLPWEDGHDPAPIQVSSRDDPAEIRFCESVESGHSSHNDAASVAEQLGIRQPPIRMDSQAKYAVVARGDADIYLRLPTRPDYHEKIWDHAGGVLIVREAGGKVTDVAGKPLEFTHGPELITNRGVIVTNGLLHDRVLAALEALGVK